MSEPGVSQSQGSVRAEDRVARVIDAPLHMPLHMPLLLLLLLLGKGQRQQALMLERGRKRECL